MRRITFILVFTLSLLPLNIHANSCSSEPGFEALCVCKAGESPGASCNHKNLITVPHDLDTNLASLDLSYNIIGLLDNVAQFYPKLLSFTLTNNNLSSITDKCFEKNNILQQLDLSYNMMKEVTVDTFLGLYSVINIDLSNNIISTIKENSFSHMTNLQTLDISSNKLVQLDYQTFTMNNGQTLNSLNLANNHFSYFPTSAISSLEGLSSLDVSGNEFVEGLGNDVFSKLGSLTKLTLRKCGLRHLGVNSFSGLHYLQYLDLSDNRLQEVPDEALNVLTELKTINIGGNFITVLGPENFKRLSRLENFFMNDCQDQELRLEEGVFRSNTDLRQINITNCDLLTPDANVNLHYLNKLQYVNLHGNRITTLHRDFLNIYDIKRFDLTGCPLVCDCHLHWLKTITMKNTHLMQGASCIDGEDFLNFFDIDESYFTCGTEGWVIAVSVVLPIVIIFSIVTVFCFWKKGIISEKTCHCKIPFNYRSPFKHKTSKKPRLSAKYQSKDDIKVIHNEFPNSNGKYIDIPQARDSFQDDDIYEDEECNLYDVVTDDLINSNYPDIKITNI